MHSTRVVALRGGGARPTCIPERDLSIDHSLSGLVLIVQLPVEDAGARLRVTQALEAEGCVCLGENSFRLRAGLHREPRLRELAHVCSRAGGAAWLMAAMPPSADVDAPYERLCDGSD